MREPTDRIGASERPTPRAAGTALAEACSEPVTDVEWCARRRLPPDDLDVIVYRGTVGLYEPTDYYVLLGAETSRVFPTTGFDSPIDLLATFQAHRRDDRDGG